MARRERETIAYHEAGHAVAGYRFGQRFAELSIRPSSSERGFCRFFDRMKNPKHEALVSFAGHAAQRYFWPEDRTPPSRSDFRNIRYFVNSMSSGEYRALMMEAKILVAANWPQVNAVAEGLLEAEFLQGDLFAKIIEAVDNGDDWRQIPAWTGLGF